MKNFTTPLFVFASLVSYAQNYEQEHNDSFGSANFALRVNDEGKNFQIM